MENFCQKHANCVSLNEISLDFRTCLSDKLNMISDYNELIEASQPFLDTLFECLESTGLNVDDLQMDHICYRVEQLEEYLKVKALINAHAMLLTESKINGRSIACFKLDEPILFRSYKLPVLELPSPKLASPYKSGYEHVEFVVNCSLEDFIESYPNIDWDLSGMKKSINRDIRIRFDRDFSVKFHEQSLEAVIKIEKNQV